MHLHDQGRRRVRGSAGVRRTAAVQLRGLRVPDCGGRGSVSEVLAAVDWLRTSAERPAVANLPQSTGRSTADDTDARTACSDHGPCVDLHAPRVLVRSTSQSGTTALEGGTSMASAHAAGVLALHVAADATASPATTTARLLATSTTGVVRADRTTTPDRLLVTGR